MKLNKRILAAISFMFMVLDCILLVADAHDLVLRSLSLA